MPKIKPGKKKFEKIVAHPDRNLITKLLSQGEGVRSVEKILKDRHPDDKSKHITFMTLQAYRKNFLNLDKEALSIIKQEEQAKLKAKQEALIDRQIKNLPSYKEALGSVKNEHIDIRRTLKNLEVLINHRMEILFDLGAQGKLSQKREENLLGYMEKQLSVLEKWGKYVDKIADKTIQTDVNITVVQDQAVLIREAILEALDEVSPEIKIKFLEKLNSKLDNTVYRKKKTTSIKNIKDSAHKMLDQYVDVEIDDG